jgi:acetyl esterase/lipase
MPARLTSSSNRPSLLERLEFAGARMLFKLPHPVQRILSGRRATVIGGRTLHPEMQLLLTLHALLRPGLTRRRSPARSREDLRRDTRSAAGRTVNVGSVVDITIPSAGGTIGARHYAPAAPEPRPLLVYYHGGGFVAGDLDTHDSVCRRLCRCADMHVLAVDYRLAPEHRFSTAVDDAFAAFRWARTNASGLGAIAERVAVAGDSAGANLAAVVCLRAKADGGTAPYAQAMFYPVLDRTIDRPSMTTLSTGFLLTREDIDWFLLQYTGSTVPQPVPEMYPLCAKDLSGLPPALIVTAGFDPLRDEAEDYAIALRNAGVPVMLREFEGLLHGFCNMAALCPSCETAVQEIAADMRAMIEA